MTVYSSTCSQCRQHCDWMPATGPLNPSRWVHREPTYDTHHPVIDWQPPDDDEVTT